MTVILYMVAIIYAFQQFYRGATIEIVLINVTDRFISDFLLGTRKKINNKINLFLIYSYNLLHHMAVQDRTKGPFS